MKLKQIISLSLIVVVSVILYFSGEKKTTAQAERNNMPLLTESIISYFPEAVYLSETDTAVYKITNNTDSILGYAIRTSPYTDHILGYGGPVPLEILIDPQYRILHIALLPGNEETPSYIEHVKIEGLLEEWDNINITEVPGKKVEAVSGATMSSEAIIETMHFRTAMLSQASFEKPFDYMNLLRNIAVLLVIGLALYNCFIPGKAKNLRLLLLSLSTLILGFWQGKMLSLSSDYNWIVNGINWTANWTLILILGLSVIIPLISGKSFYCTYMCPYGALQELIGKITKRKIVIPEKLRNILLLLRPVYLIVIVIALLIRIPVDLANFEPFAAFAIRSASTSVLILAGFFLGLSVFLSRPWCKYFCPTGTLLDQFRRKK